MASDHAEYRYKAIGSDTVIVFIHGVLGSPSTFTFMIDKLGDAYSIENLLLPGHGGTIQDFAASSMAKWQAYVDDRVKTLQYDYQHIILVGHSMGCLLAVQTAVSYPDKIRGLFLLAAPLVIRVRSPYVKSKTVSAFQHTELAAAAESSNSVRTDKPYLYVTALPRFIELYTKSKKTRYQIGNLCLPIMAVHSENDETVSIKSLRYFDDMQNVSVMIAKDSRHFYYPKETKSLLSDALLHFVTQLAPDAQTALI